MVPQYCTAEAQCHKLSIPSLDPAPPMPCSTGLQSTVFSCVRYLSLSLWCFPFVLMDSEVIAQMYASLYPDNEPPPLVNFPDDIVTLKESRLSRCLICKVLTSRSINKEAFRHTMSTAWKSQMTVTIESLGENRFICEFNSEKDKWQILNDRP